MNKEEFLSNIEEYLNGHLTTTQTAAFEQAMNGNVELQQAFQKRKETVRNLKKIFVFESRKQELKQLIEAKKKEKMVAANKLRPLWPSYLRRVAAILAIALFLGAAYWFFMQSPPPNYQQLALTTFEQTDDKSLTGISVTMGETTEADIEVTLMNAEKIYKEDKPKEALLLLKKINTEGVGEQQYKVILLRALCQLKMKNMVAAKENLDLLLQHPDQLYDDQVEWFSTLIELHKGESDNVTKAKQQLQNIISEGGTYQKEAQELLGKL